MKEAREKIQKKKKENPRINVKKKVVHKNSSKQLSKQIELLSMELNFGVAPRRFPIVGYVTATEVFCQKLEGMGDSESVEKARAIRSEVFIQLERSYKMVLRSNLTERQRKILQL